MRQLAKILQEFPKERRIVRAEGTKQVSRAEGTVFFERKALEKERKAPKQRNKHRGVDKDGNTDVLPSLSLPSLPYNHRCKHFWKFPISGKHFEQAKHGSIRSNGFFPAEKKKSFLISEVAGAGETLSTGPKC